MTTRTAATVPAQLLAQLESADDWLGLRMLKLSKLVCAVIGSCLPVRPIHITSVGSFC